MLGYANSSNCSGCSACEQKCPVHCIRMEYDEYGFTYPRINVDECINCGLCEKVCYLYQDNAQVNTPIRVFAARNPNTTIRKESSSGGVFSLFAENVISRGGYVVGASWNDDWMVEHIVIDKISQLNRLRTSKYVQSKIDDCYIKTEQLLKKGHIVLFSGMPCQISGLRAFLAKDYDNLFCVECVCFGVPSPGVWVGYLNELLLKLGKKREMINSINMRDKSSGWEGYSCSINFSDGTRYSQNAEDDLWMRGYRNGLFTRPSCYNCARKIDHSLADITIGDFWGMSELIPELNDHMGEGIVIVNSHKGEALIEKSNCKADVELDVSRVIPLNPAISSNIEVDNKKLFFERLQKKNSVCKSIRRIAKRPVIYTIKRKVYSFLYK